MANDNKNGVTRSFVRFLRFLRISMSSDIADHGQLTPADSVNYGAYTTDELRHFDGIAQKFTGRPPSKSQPREDTIGTYLESVSDSTHSKIRELKNLTAIAPEIKLSSRVIVSTIMSPTNLQTNRINITMNYNGISQDTKTKILDKLNTFFNDEHHFAPKLASWLKTAGFEEGAKAIIVLPKHELDVQNAVQDVLAAHEDLRIAAQHISASTEDLFIPERRANKDDKTLLEDRLEVEIERGLESLGATDFFDEKDEHGKKVHTYNEKIEKNGSTENVSISGTQDLVKALRTGTFKLLNINGDGSVVVTRDLHAIKDGVSKNKEALNDLLKDARAQMSGFNPNSGCTSIGMSRTLSISDDIKIGENDLPIVIELPSDSVIPVCAPRDNKNHIGYFILLDENGQPLSGKDNYFRSGSTDVTNRLAMNAARGIYGNATLSSFAELANSPEVVLRQMSDVFAVAVNKLLESKLKKNGLIGMHVSMHNAVGKALFLNLLAKNKVKMVFVPEPMMVYYRFDHRDDGTGKTLLEDASQMLALRTTFMVARLMAAVDNATMHRTIEVDIDEKDNNPVQTLQMVVHQALSKYTPSFSTEVQTAAESMVNRNISVKPKSMAGTTDNLSVSIDKSYGNAQAPDTDLMDKLNNWIGMAMGGLPASVLNQLSENEFSRSVATTNMYFSNQIEEWQNTIRPYNKKYVTLYTSCNANLVKMIREILGAEKKSDPDPKATKDNESKDTKDEKIETQIRDIIQSLEVDLPQPQMAVKKAHFEEIQAFADAVEKIVQIIYSDDVVVDDELKSNMGTIRAVITSKILREFLPKLGCQAIADIPEPSSIEADYATKMVLYLKNIKRRIKNLGDLANGTLPKSAEDALAKSLVASPEGEEPTDEDQM